MNPSNGVFGRAVRFSLTGLFVTFVHVLVATLWIKRVHPLPSIANGVAFVAATLVGLLINSYWSFNFKLTSEVGTRYFAVAVLGLVVSMGLSHAIYLAGLSYWVGIALVVVVMPVMNFLMHHYWTYRV